MSDYTRVGSFWNQARFQALCYGKTATAFYAMGKLQLQLHSTAVKPPIQRLYSPPYLAEGRPAEAVALCFVSLEPQVGRAPALRRVARCKLRI
jgi:hypothetical protein